MILSREGYPDSGLIPALKPRCWCWESNYRVILTNVETGETVKTTDYSKGDVLFAATLQPGIRFRFWKNLHLFLGPTVSTNTVGLHLGVGF